MLINHNRINEVALTLKHAEDPSTPFPSATAKDKPGKVGEYTEKGGTGTVAVVCPFCSTMLKDAVGDTGREENIRVKDVTELVADALVETRKGGAAGVTPGVTVSAKPE